MLARVLEINMVLCLIFGAALFDANEIVGSVLVLASVAFYFLAKKEGAFSEEDFTTSDIDDFIRNERRSKRDRHRIG